MIGQISASNQLRTS